jgi:putative heme-binding domain-containing protein
MEALCALPDPKAASVYLEAIDDHDPQLRRAAEAALVAIRGNVLSEIELAAGMRTLSEPASLALQRVLARFEPIVDWRVIGPFPRATPVLFLGQSSIDFARTYSGAIRRRVAWAPRRADPTGGRVELNDLKDGAGDHGGFGYDISGSPDLCAFAYAEVEATQNGTGLMLLGSSGTLIVTVNEELVYRYEDPAGRRYSPETDTARLSLRKGRNRILVMSRQGVGPWCFGVQVARLSHQPGGSSPAPAPRSALRNFALEHRGDPRKGAEIFFDPRGIRCFRCHRAGRRGSATIGPDLTGLASKYDRAEVIRSVLEPSDRIATGYQPVVVATRGGQIESGVVRAESDHFLELADSQTNITRIPKRDIEIRRLGAVSIMPAESVESLTPGEFGDLIEFLMSLTAAGSAAPAP